MPSEPAVHLRLVCTGAPSDLSLVLYRVAQDHPQRLAASRTSHGLLVCIVARFCQVADVCERASLRNTGENRHRMPKRTYPTPPELDGFADRCREAYALAYERGVRTDSMQGIDKATASRLAPRRGPQQAPNPAISVAVWFARACGVRVGWLLTGEEPREGTLQRLPSSTDLFARVPPVFQIRDTTAEIAILAEDRATDGTKAPSGSRRSSGKRPSDPARRAK